MKIEHGRAAAGIRRASSRTRATKFGVLSEAIDTYMTGLHLTPPGGRASVAYCPMVRKPWLQKDETIANPYYGTRC